MKYVLMILCASLFTVLAAAQTTAADGSNPPGYTPPNPGPTSSNGSGTVPSAAPKCNCDVGGSGTDATIATCVKGQTCDAVRPTSKVQNTDDKTAKGHTVKESGPKK